MTKSGTTNKLYHRKKNKNSQIGMQTNNNQTGTQERDNSSSVTESIVVRKGTTELHSESKKDNTVVDKSSHDNQMTDIDMDINDIVQSISNSNKINGNEGTDIINTDMTNMTHTNTDVKDISVTDTDIENTNINTDTNIDVNTNTDIDAEKSHQKESSRSYTATNSLNLHPVHLGEIKTNINHKSTNATERNYQYNGSHPVPRTKKISHDDHEDILRSHHREDELASTVQTPVADSDVVSTQNTDTTLQDMNRPTEAEPTMLADSLDYQTDLNNNQSLSEQTSIEHEPKYAQLPDPVIETTSKKQTSRFNRKGKLNNPKKDNEGDKLTSFKKLGAVLVATLALVTLIKSDKLAGYWQQSYDGSTTLDNVAQSGLGKAGSAVDDLAKKNNLKENLGAISNSINNEANSVFYDKKDDNANQVQNLDSDSNQIQANGNLVKTPEDQGKTTTESSVPADSLATGNSAIGLASAQNGNTVNNSTANSASNTSGSQGLQPNVITLNHSDKAFFIGDSLMQGVAPWVMRDLQKNHKIDSINLSKHSTGLTFAKFFDWPSTVEKTLKANPDVKALFVFLGGNDGQSIIDPNTQRHVRFGGERWDEIYSQNIHKILDLAKQHNVQVLWVTPPAMKSASLNEKMAHLSELFAREVPKAGIVIESNKILQLNTDTGYSDSMIIEGKKVKTRTADGVHFTTKGQKHIAKVILDTIKVANTATGVSNPRMQSGSKSASSPIQ